MLILVDIERLLHTDELAAIVPMMDRSAIN